MKRRRPRLRGAVCVCAEGGCSCSCWGCLYLCESGCSYLCCWVLRHVLVLGAATRTFVVGCCGTCLCGGAAWFVRLLRACSGKTFCTRRVDPVHAWLIKTPACKTPAKKVTVCVRDSRISHYADGATYRRHQRGHCVTSGSNRFRSGNISLHLCGQSPGSTGIPDRARAPLLRNR